MVECYRTDDVKQLLDNLFHQVWVHPMLTHGGVEVAKTLQQDFHCNSSLLWETGASLPQACWFGPQHALDCFVLQHACHYKTQIKEKYISCVSVTVSLLIIIVR